MWLDSYITNGRYRKELATYTCPNCEHKKEFLIETEYGMSWCDEDTFCWKCNIEMREDG